MSTILFVTGTDTGAGKTVLTAMLLAFLRGGGCDALAMKPFCSGPRRDALRLRSLQRERLTLDEINPFYFDKPVAPAAAGKGRFDVPLEAALKEIQALADRCEVLVVEGVGGLLAPLGRDYSVRDLIRRLDCKTIVVCRNRLGVINHALLTAEALEHVGVEEFTIVMMGVGKPDLSARTNPVLIRQRLGGRAVFCVPYLGKGASRTGGAKNNVKYLKIMLARLVGGGNLATFFHKRKKPN